jgi:hypothetical protein
MKFLSTSLFGVTSILFLIYCYPAALVRLFNDTSAILHSRSENTIGLRIYIVSPFEETNYVD